MQEESNDERSRIAWSEATAEDRDQNGSDDVVRWTASEFIDHQKDGRWYTNLALVVLGAALIVWLLTKDEITAVVVIVAGLAFGFYAAREPRELTYQFDHDGFTIGERPFSYSSFRSFSIDDDAAFSSIVLLPLRRFAPSITLYYAPQNEEQIANMIANHLPYQPHRVDPIDRLMRRIRF